jgi:hypothetical protein
MLCRFVAGTDEPLPANPPLAPRIVIRICGSAPFVAGAVPRIDIRICGSAPLDVGAVPRIVFFMGISAGGGVGVVFFKADLRGCAGALAGCVGVTGVGATVGSTLTLRCFGFAGAGTGAS